MLPELLKFGSGLSSLAIVSYTIIKVSENGNSAKFESSYGNFELGRDIKAGNKDILSEMSKMRDDVKNLRDNLNNLESRMRDDMKGLQAHVTARCDEFSLSLNKSNAKIAKELSYLNLLATQTHVYVELLKKKWSFNVSDSDRDIFLSELAATGKAGRENSDSV